MPSKLCRCGSGRETFPNYDARGIFLTFTCTKCNAEKMRKYRPEVLTNPNYWADEPIEPE